MNEPCLQTLRELLRVGEMGLPRDRRARWLSDWDAAYAPACARADALLGTPASGDFERELYFIALRAAEVRAGPCPWRSAITATAPTDAEVEAARAFRESLDEPDERRGAALRRAAGMPADLAKRLRELVKETR